jgi:hypothetical protein
MKVRSGFWDYNRRLCGEVEGEQCGWIVNEEDKEDMGHMITFKRSLGDGLGGLFW